MAPPVITAALATSLLATLLRHSQADLGTCQVEPHRAQVLVDACGCHGNRMQGSSPHSGARVKRPPVDRMAAVRALLQRLPGDRWRLTPGE
jgi:hypothetical protein